MQFSFSWDINALDELPYYMKISFFALFQSINEIGYNILKEQGINVVPSLKKLVLVLISL
jgi:hypothetical protein